MRCAGCKRDQPVEAKRDTARLGYDRERLQKLLVDGLGLAIDPLPLRHRGLKSLPLQNGIGQFAKTVRRFDAPDLQKYEHTGTVFGAPIVIKREHTCGGRGVAIVHNTLQRSSDPGLPPFGHGG
jgi:hypothetical protein